MQKTLNHTPKKSHAKVMTDPYDLVIAKQSKSNNVPVHLCSTKTCACSSMCSNPCHTQTCACK